MSIEALKKQASRLASYLSRNHRVNLKHSSALEAIAAAHGARNWPTLAAQGIPVTESEPKSGPRGDESGIFPLTWKGEMPSMQIPGRDWFRHTLATGAGALRRTWLVDHLLSCERAGAGGVFINVIGPGFAPILDLHRDGGDDAPAPQYNLLAGLTPEEMARVLMHAYPQERDFPIRTFIRDQCSMALRLILPQELAPGETVSLASVLSAIDPKVLLVRMRVEVRFGDELRTITGAHTEMTQAELLGHLDRMFGPLSKQLHEVLRTPVGKAIFANTRSLGSGARSVVDCFCRGDLLHVTIPEEGPGAIALQGMWMETMARAAARLNKMPAPAAKPLVLGILNCPFFSGDALQTLAEQSRGRQLALLLTEGPGKDLGSMPNGRRVLQNIHNHLHLGAPDEKLKLELLRRLEGSEAQLLSVTSVSFS